MLKASKVKRHSVMYSTDDNFLVLLTSARFSKQELELSRRGRLIDIAPRTSDARNSELISSRPTSEVERTFGSFPNTLSLSPHCK